jgi:hypothetical protein
MAALGTRLLETDIPLQEAIKQHLMSTRTRFKHQVFFVLD